MLTRLITDKDAKLKFVITGEYRNLEDFVDAIKEWLCDAEEDVVDNIVYERCVTGYVDRESSTVTIFV